MLKLQTIALIPGLLIIFTMCTCSSEKEPSRELPASTQKKGVNHEPGRLGHDKRVPGQYIFRVRPNTPEREVKTLLNEVYAVQGVKSIKVLMPDHFLLIMEKDLDPEDAGLKVREHRLIEHVQPNYTYSNQGF